MRVAVRACANAAELLTTDKLSELACLTLFLMFEKKLGEESEWYPYIKVRVGWKREGVAMTEAAAGRLCWRW